MLRAVIFDVDGTLVDSVDLHARSWQQAFRHVGREVPLEKIRSQIGKGSDQIIPMFLSPEEARQVGPGVDDYRSGLFLKEYLPQVRPFEGTRELFLRLKSDRVQTALASSAKGQELETYKRLAAIENLVDVETAAEEVQQTKPAPDIFAAALRKLGNPAPESVLVVGDTPYDAEAAGKLRLGTIGLLCGGFPEKDLRDAGCIAIYRDPADLLANYNGSPLGYQLRSAA
jgi:phosphoglycolate phosphatase-like HAD superfamily hydrolase